MAIVLLKDIEVHKWTVETYETSVNAVFQSKFIYLVFSHFRR